MLLAYLKCLIPLGGEKETSALCLLFDIVIECACGCRVLSHVMAKGGK